MDHGIHGVGIAPTGHAAPDPQLLGALAVGLADRFADLYGVRPADPRAVWVDDTLLLSFQGGLGRADERMLEMNRGKELRRFRERFLEVTADALISVVETMTGASVASYFTGFDLDTRTTRAVFVLSSDAGPREEERRALLNWSAQMRRNARLLREEHVAIRRSNRDLTVRLRRLRDESVAGRAARHPQP